MTYAFPQWSAKEELWLTIIKLIQTLETEMGWKRDKHASYRLSKNAVDDFLTRLFGDYDFEIEVSHVSQYKRDLTNPG